MATPWSGVLAAEQTMTELPYADPTVRAELLDWLDRFARYVREVDYASARPLFHPDILAFGTHRDVITGLDTWVRAQWDNVCRARRISGLILGRPVCWRQPMAGWRWLSHRGPAPDTMPMAPVSTDLAGQQWCFSGSTGVGYASTRICR